MLALCALPTLSAMPTDTAQADRDPHLWLEEVQGERALAWVRERNAATRAVLQQHPRFATMRDGFRAILDSADKIPYVSRRGEALYNFWRDAQHPRGLWRRTTLASYRQPQPDWETVIDLDALAQAEDENWVWAGATCLGPHYQRCLVQLSRGGADATVVREFDSRSKRFDDDGFTLPEAKTDVAWESADSLLVGTDFGPGTLTDSGYPRLIKRWRRGQPLSAAATVFEGRAQDVSVSAAVDRTPGHQRTVVARSTDFYNAEQFILAGDQLRRINIPSDAEIHFWGARALLQLRSDWAVGARRWPAGSLLVGDAKAILAAKDAASMPPLAALFTPTATRSLAGFSTSRSQVLVNVLDNVAGRLEAWQPAATGDGWQRREIPAPFPGTLSAQALHDPELGEDALAEAYTLSYTDFLTPDSLMLGHTGGAPLQPLKARPAFFDSSALKVEQHFATSKDGTQVPYFLISAKTTPLDGANPTLLYGYGGFEVSQQPWYSAGFGTAWLAQGGVLAVANIRGGGEFGPAWHQAATKAHKQRSYDDFAAVAEDLIARKITQPRHLGIQGGSNGGLLVGAVMLQRPELFGAVVCQVPLLDMRRYHRLLAGASWMAEYGDPDQPDEWAWIARYSPYQNVTADMKLPQVLFTTSTRDDRVHPGHARKMAARMLEQGHAPLYYENIEGGHAGAADNGQKADMMALEFAFLWRRLQRR
ncbi:MAG: prolyl oligopeptidase [Burkholderiales bacterium RIFCSPHIGHO2_12_FULL_69_20]|nr:MAG: prolyl oligopeptidase [Burkholderiales bacterium RIFCSPHIGHO2_12_FULL_69_20]